MPDSALESEIHRIGSDLARDFPSSARHPVKALDDKAMELASRDAELKAALFRFVDVVPACRSLEDLAGHLSAYLAEVDERPPPLDVAMRMADSRAGSRALGLAAAAGVRHMAHRFIVGETPADALDLLEELWRNGVASSVDLLGEATVTVDEADGYASRCAEALRTLADSSKEWPERPHLERDSGGVVPRVNLSVKVSALTPLLRPEAPDVGKRDAAGRLRELMRARARLAARICTSTWNRSIARDRLAARPRAPVRRRVQRGTLGRSRAAGIPAGFAGDLERIFEWAIDHRRTHPLVVRLVKGAYWDHEIVEARRHGWPAPVFEDKAECDRNFESLTRRLLEAHRTYASRSRPTTCARSLTRSPATALLGGDDADLEIQVLRGLGDDLQHALAKSGMRVRTYCPWATSSPVWRTWFGGCWRTPATSRSSPPSRAIRSRGAAGRAVRPFRTSGRRS